MTTEKQSDKQNSAKQSEKDSMTQEAERVAERNKRGETFKGQGTEVKK